MANRGGGFAGGRLERHAQQQQRQAQEALKRKLEEAALEQDRDRKKGKTEGS